MTIIDFSAKDAIDDARADSVALTSYLMRARLTAQKKSSREIDVLQE